MSAFYDYPPIPNGANVSGGWGALHLRMCNEIDRLRASVMEMTFIAKHEKYEADKLSVALAEARHLGKLEFAQSGKWQEMAEDLWEELRLWHADGCPTKWTSRAPGECTCHRILATRWDEITHAADWSDDGLEDE